MRLSLVISRRTLVHLSDQRFIPVRPLRPQTKGFPGTLCALRAPRRPRSPALPSALLRQQIIRLSLVNSRRTLVHLSDQRLNLCNPFNRSKRLTGRALRGPAPAAFASPPSTVLPHHFFRLSLVNSRRTLVQLSYQCSDQFNPFIRRQEASRAPSARPTPAAFASPPVCPVEPEIFRLTLVTSRRILVHLSYQRSDLPNLCWDEAAAAPAQGNCF